MDADAATCPSGRVALGDGSHGGGRARGGAIHPAIGRRRLLMTVRAWRIVKRERSSTAFSGAGAKRSGGRWNSPGTSMIYTAGSAALAMLELLVHLQAPELLKGYVLFEVSFAERLMRTLSLRTLPRNWRNPVPPRSLPRIGDAWIQEQTSAILEVPSAIVPGESNFLLNPLHPDFGGISIGARTPVRFDPRLVKRSTQ